MTNYSATGGQGYQDGNLVTRHYPDAFKKYNGYITVVRGGFQRLFARKDTTESPVGSRTLEVKVSESITRGEAGVYSTMHYGIMEFYNVVYVYRTGTPRTKTDIDPTGGPSARTTKKNAKLLLYELFIDGKRVGRENYAFQDAVNNLLINTKRHRGRRVTARYAGHALVVTGTGYELFWDYKRVGHEPRWDRAMALRNLRWNISRYPEKRVVGLFNGVVMTP